MRGERVAPTSHFPLLTSHFHLELQRSQYTRRFLGRDGEAEDAFDFSDGQIERHGRGRFGIDVEDAFGNFAAGTEAGGKDPVSVAEYTTRQFSPAVSWADLDWFRSLWPGPIAIKGIMSAEDARRAVEHGMDAIVVSNHGGRQLDFVPSPISVLPEIVEAVAGRAEIILDGGVRRGSDVVKAIALGARACMVGRAFNYGVAADGERGAARAIEILQTEIDRCLALIGRPTLADLDRSAVRSVPCCGH